jgi:dynein heavy chain
LGKVEELVAASNSGRSPQLADYYSFWERHIFAALNQAVANGMNKLQTLFTGQQKTVGLGGRRTGRE